MAQGKTHYRSCNLCEAMCGIAIEYEGQTITSIKGDDQDPFSRGHICPKALALKDLYDDPDRLREPLEKHQGQWRKISWESALEKTAERIRALQDQHGHDAFGVYLGNPNVHNFGGMLSTGDLLRRLRTRNKFSATSVDQLPHHIVAWKLFGHQLRIPVPDLDHCDHFVILGGNPLASNGSIMTVADVKKRLQAINQRGKLVVIDPRRSETARLAKEHHFIRPGTDVLLLLAMLNVLFAEDRVQPGRLSEWLNEDPGTLAAHFAPYRPERVAAICGIDAKDIRALVQDFCAADAPVLYGRMGVSVQRFGALCQYLIMLFNLLTARVDSRGGLMFTRPAADILPQTGRGHMDRYRSRVRGLPEFNGELPVSALAEEIRTPGEGQIRGMLLMAGNPVISTPDGPALDQAFASLDFMVSIDFYINESNRHADIILPPVSPLERDHYDLIFHLLAVRNTARYSPALFEAPKDAWHDWQITQDLAQRLRPARGLPERLKQQAQSALTPRRKLDLLLRTGPYGGGKAFWRGMSLKQLEAEPHGVDLGPLQPELPGALFHKDRKIHLSGDFFLPDLARVEKEFFATDTSSEPNLLLIGRRDLRSNNSWLHNSRRLVKGKPRCTALVHPQDLQAHGLEDGDLIRVRSSRGEIQIAAQACDDIMPGVISIPHGWGHDKSETSWQTAQAHAGVSVNALTDPSQLDELSGNAVLNGVPVSIAAA